MGLSMLGEHVWYWCEDFFGSWGSERACCSSDNPSTGADKARVSLCRTGSAWAQQDMAPWDQPSHRQAWQSNCDEGLQKTARGLSANNFPPSIFACVCARAFVLCGGWSAYLHKISGIWISRSLSLWEHNRHLEEKWDTTNRFLSENDHRVFNTNN